MNYSESLDYLYSRLPMFQRIGAAAIKKDLTNTLRMLEALGNPHRRFKTIHVAGTNGKGTSSHALAAILQSAGYRTGLYTSPHLKSFTERIRINGAEVAADYVADFVTQHQSLIEEVNPSFFEVTVAMAFDYFASEGVDMAVIETGLGGRLDSTNVITPDVSLITMIGWDHADLLGDTLEQIAGEKAGIIKPGVPVVIGAHQPDLLPVFRRKAADCQAPLIAVDDTRVQITGATSYSQTVAVDGHVFETDITARYFARNIPGVLAVVQVLQQAGWAVAAKHVADGLQQVKTLTGLKGRWQILKERPLTVADISHNEPGLKALFQQIAVVQPRKLHLVFGVVRDKDLTKILSLLPAEAYYYFTQSGVPRSLPAVELQAVANVHGLSGAAFTNVNTALEAAWKVAHPEDLIVVCGSTFVVAEINFE